MRRRFKKRSVGAKITAFALVCILLTGCSASGVADDPTLNPAGTGVESEEYFDELTPATDFYGYVNAKTLMKATLDSNKRVAGPTDAIGKVVESDTDAIIDEIIASDEEFEPGSNEEMIHDLYHLVYKQLDGQTDVDASDTAFVEAVIKKIDSVKTMDELWKLWNYLSLEYGFDAYYNASLKTNLYEKSEYIMEFQFCSVADLETMMDNQLVAMQKRDDMAAQLKVAGVPSDEAEKRATDVIYMLYEVAAHTDFDIVNGDKEEEEYFNLYTREEFEQSFRGVSFDNLMYSAGVNSKYGGRVVIVDPEQFNAIAAVTDEAHVQQWKDIALYRFLNEYATWMPAKYNFSGNTELEADKTARAVVRAQLNTNIGELYLKRHFSEETKETVTRMCEEMRSEYRVLIGGAYWLSEEGRAFLLKKLDKMQFYVGGLPEKEIVPEDADVLKSPSVLTALFKIAAYMKKGDIKKLGTTAPVDKGPDGVSAAEVNAFYSPQDNCIVICAGILHAPFYDENADYAVNLGGIGAVIGHEISHGFDSSGVNYDENGNYNPEIMPKADRDAFKAKQQSAIDYYNQFTVLGSHVNGKRTLGENFADISGLQCVLALVKTKEEQKEVFESYAKSWELLIEDNYAMLLLEKDVHAPDKVRVNAVVACFDEYYEVYDVKEGDPMYIPPEERVRRW